MGPMGKRTYGDFNAMMSKGGNMDNLSMGPQVTEELVKSCKAIINTCVCFLKSPGIVTAADRGEQLKGPLALQTLAHSACLHLSPLNCERVD